MEHRYKISGMTCEHCKQQVENILLKTPGVKSAKVDLNTNEATVVMSHHIDTKTLKKSFANSGYMIYDLNEKIDDSLEPHTENTTTNNEKGVYYCPMHCEGDKTYDQPGNCPVCGMNLVKEVNTVQHSGLKYTCPMHPEIIKDEPGNCPICGMTLVPLQIDESEEQKTYKDLLKKFKIAVAFTLPIFLIAMSEMVNDNPLYKIMDVYYWNWVQFILSIPVVFYATWMFFQRAYASIVRKSLNMFTLIGIGSGVAWLFSVFGMLFPQIFPDEFKTEYGTVHVYFEASTVILTLVLLGQLLEARAHSKTNSAVKELLKLAPNKALKIEDGKEIEISIESIKVGDILKVKPGEKIPVDGVITEGKTSIDESMITGEPIPVEKEENDKVIAGTINGTQTFLMKAEKVGTDTLLSQIIKMVNNASRSRAPIQKIADKISGYFVPIVIFIAIITFFVWYFIGPEPRVVYGFVNAIAVLIIACPCALGLATPMSVMVGVGKGAQEGILIKNAEALETMNKINVLIIDKTGTVTEGKPTVEFIKSFDPTINQNKLIEIVASVNNHSEHPLAEATVKFANLNQIELKKVTHFESITGKGVKGNIDEDTIYIGNKKLLENFGIKFDHQILEAAEIEQQKGKTVPFIAINNKMIGFIVIHDPIKKNSKTAIEKLHQKGVHVIMMTGDNKYTAQSVAKALNITEFYANCLPQDKLNKVKELKDKGQIVAMAGDGINDAPALALADVGIAMGTGTDVAIESASITLLKGDINGIEKAYILSKKVMTNIKQNLFFALVYNTIGIPIAAGVLYPVFGILLSPMIAALAMSFSSVSVIANALRLRTIKLN